MDQQYQRVLKYYGSSILVASSTVLKLRSWEIKTYYNTTIFTSEICIFIPTCYSAFYWQCHFCGHSCCARHKKLTGQEGVVSNGERKFKLDIRKKNLYFESGEALEQETLWTLLPSRCSEPVWIWDLSSLVQWKVSLFIAGDLKLGGLYPLFQPKPF